MSLKVYSCSHEKKTAAAVALLDTAVMVGNVSLFQARKTARKVMDTVLMGRALYTQPTASNSTYTQQTPPAIITLIKR